MDAQRIADSATTDQTAEAWRNHARVMHAFYSQLRIEGFSKAEAFGLVMQAHEMSLQRILFGSGEGHG